MVLWRVSVLERMATSRCNRRGNDDEVGDAADQERRRPSHVKDRDGGKAAEGDSVCALR